MQCTSDTHLSFQALSPHNSPTLPRTNSASQAVLLPTNPPKSSQHGPAAHYKQQLQDSQLAPPPHWPQSSPPPMPPPRAHHAQQLPLPPTQVAPTLLDGRIKTLQQQQQCSRQTDRTQSHRNQEPINTQKVTASLLYCSAPETRSCTHASGQCQVDLTVTCSTSGGLVELHINHSSMVPSTIPCSPLSMQ
jgi:hypothetical protein